MSKKLVIVESPAKAKTISRYLGDGYEVTASKGHVRDLPESSFGVDLETLEPTYEILKGKQKVVADLKKMARGKEILLAPDIDREGEAIAWHISELLGVSGSSKVRLVFNEITREAIRSAVASPRTIDMHKVNSQLARRVLDRIVGYKLSPLLWRSIAGGLSAGRVQSVALRFIVELEKKIAEFIPHDFYRIYLQIGNERIPLAKIDGKKFGPESITSRDKLDGVIKELNSSTFVVDTVTRKKRRRNPPPPFITSTLQQAAVSGLGWSASKTMKVAQQLYEGLETPEGNVAFITYMRTDSTRVSEEAKKKTGQLIEDTFGKDYRGYHKTSSRKQSKIQDAHEAIRPTYVERSPDQVKKLISGDQLKLYSIIWERFVASQMAPSEYEVTSVSIKDQDGKYAFNFENQEMLFDGFEKLLPQPRFAKQVELELKEGEEVVPDAITNELDTTKPPSRFSEASLVKELEKRGIGRPSTYAAIIGTLFDRKYIVKSGRELMPTLLGSVVSDFLTAGFPDVIDGKFTATMESELDGVENAEKDWKSVITDFMNSFAKDLDLAEKQIKNGRGSLEYRTDKPCECGGSYKLVFGRYGGYLKCSECDRRESLDMTLPLPIVNGEVQLKEKLSELNLNATLDEKCPKCGADLMVKRGRFGEFVACSAYPKCKYTRNLRLDVPCPKCGGAIERLKSKKGKTYFKCSDCGELFWREPTRHRCDKCQGVLSIKYRRGGSKVLHCQNCKLDFPMRKEENGS